MQISGDQEVYLKAISDNSDVSPVTTRDVLWINDQNNGSYNGMITFDTSQFNSSSKWLNYSEAYIQIPFVVSVRADTDATADNVIGPYFLGLRNGYHSLIDSLSVEYGTKNVVQLQSYLNFHTSFKLMTSFSQDDLAKYGSTIGFIPDSAGSYTFGTVASALGDGYSNIDEVYETHAQTTIRPQSFNEGFLKRRAMTTAFRAAGYGPNTVNSADKCTKIGKNYFLPDAGAGAARIYNYYIIATIRLKDLSEFFSKISLVKNGSMRLTINYNSATTIIDVTTAGAMSIGSHVQNSGHTNPVMIGQALVSGPRVLPVGGPGVAYKVTISSGVLKNNLNTSGGGFAITACRLYVPSYKLDPKSELALITKNPITKVHYNDIYSYKFNVASTESFNQVLTNGIVDAQYLLLVPFVRGSETGTFASAEVRIPVYQSIFDSAGSTTSPLCALTELQISIAGENVFTSNERYDYEAFLNELSRINALMGGVTTSLTSGLIDRFMFDNAYRYYIADLSRRSSSEDLVPKSIQVSGTNVTGLPLEIHAFVAYKRHLNIDTLTGMEL